MTPPKGLVPLESRGLSGGCAPVTWRTIAGKPMETKAGEAGAAHAGGSNVVFAGKV